jgi:type I restriction enzyme, S subunit
MTQVGGSTVYPIPKGWRLFVANDIKSPEPHACVAGPFGSKISSKYFVDEGVPVIRGSNLRDDLTRFIPEGFVFVSEARAQEYRPQHTCGGDLVFTCWGTIGQVGLVPEDGPYSEYIISNKQLKLRVDRNVADPLFCFYYFASPRYTEYIRNRSIGGAVPGINLGILKSLPIALPPLTVQRQIASILSAYDDLIENNQRRMARLEESARLLYREWFVRLRFPGYEHTRITNGVPEGWECKAFECALVLQRGFDLPIQAREDGDVPIYGSTGINGFHNKAKVPGPGVVTGRSGTLGEVHYVAGDFWPLNTALWVKEFKRVTPLFSLFLMREMDLKQYNGGVSVPTLDRKTVHRVEVLIPPKSLLAVFDEFVVPLFEQMENLTLQNQKLRTARDLLLPKLMSGEITV